MPHPAIAMINDPTKIFLTRLIDIEARRISDRLAARGLSRTAADAFEKKAAAVLGHSLTAEPGDFSKQITELADRTSRVALFSKRRDSIRETVERGLSGAAGMIRDRNAPIATQDPFSVAFETDMDVANDDRELVLQ